MKRILWFLTALGLVLAPAAADAQKISALPASSQPLVAGDVVPIVNSATTKKATADQINGVLYQSAVAASHTGDTTAFTAATIAIPAAAMGANGRIEVRLDFTYPSSSNVKTLTVKLGSTTLWSATPTTSTGLNVELFITNRNSQASQRWSARHFLSSGTVGVTTGTAAVDTSAAQNLTVTEQLASSTETVTLEAGQIVLFPKS